MKLTYPEVTRQISALAEQLQLCENIHTRNEIECELRALEMIIAYYHGIARGEADQSVARAAA